MTAEEATKVYNEDRQTAMRLCPHTTVTYRPGERPCCEACGAEQARILWMDPQTGTVLT